ncbi:SDR family NAD(P)-dependent oxidoreductase [Streptomyces griseosporeus]|uniref:SDR family NAD(P)-dependent oxidoreductase n=1 Tax=Streptomyces griseosporeus TaxID=1910 RepID=UPI0036FED464
MNANDTGQSRLSGRTAIVTGASRGIGLAIDERLVSEGARVCLTARKSGPLEEAAAALPQGKVITVADRADDPSTAARSSTPSRASPGHSTSS